MDEERESRSQLKQFMDQWQYSLTAVGKALGVSTAAMSQYLAGTYPGNVRKIDKAAISFLRREKERQAAPKRTIPFQMTSVAGKVFDIARMCHIEGEIGVIYGSAGAGKTVALAEYAEQNPDVVLIQATLGFSSKVLFLELSRQLGTDIQGSIHDMFKNVVTKLKKSGRLIVVDEAEHLPYRALELLRSVYDQARVGILLAGMDKLIHNLRGKKGEYSQLYSRVGMAVRLDGLTLKDTEAIVSSVIPSANGTSKVFHQEAHGNSRALSKLIFGALRTARINNVPLTAEIVRETSKWLIV